MYRKHSTSLSRIFHIAQNLTTYPQGTRSESRQVVLLQRSCLLLGYTLALFFIVFEHARLYMEIPSLPNLEPLRNPGGVEGKLASAIEVEHGEEEGEDRASDGADGRIRCEQIHYPVREGALR